jgi:hypothetical protein
VINEWPQVMLLDRSSLDMNVISTVIKAEHITERKCNLNDARFKLLTAVFLKVLKCSRMFISSLGEQFSKFRKFFLPFL